MRENKMESAIRADIRSNVESEVTLNLFCGAFEAVNEVNPESV